MTQNIPRISDILLIALSLLWQTRANAYCRDSLADRSQQNTSLLLPLAKKELPAYRRRALSTRPTNSTEPYSNVLFSYYILVFINTIFLWQLNNYRIKTIRNNEINFNFFVVFINSTYVLYISFTAI